MPSFASFYPLIVSSSLLFCSTAIQSAFVLIDGEEAQNFVAGLADNVGLESTRAARMVSAAVAARTRSRFLQAWVRFFYYFELNSFFAFGLLEAGYDIKNLNPSTKSIALIYFLFEAIISSLAL